MAWEPIIQQSAMQFGLDPQMWYRQIMQESAGNQYAQSHMGARGPAQVMPGTAANPGFGMRPLSDVYNPSVAIPWAAEYLRKHIDYYGGDVAKGVAAYNAGAGNVNRAVAQGGANWQNFVPAETKKYLNIVQPWNVGGSQPQPLGLDAGQVYQQGPQKQAAPATPANEGRVLGVDAVFSPPYGSIRDWAFDQNMGRWVDRNDLGKAYSDIPSYHLGEGGQWEPWRQPGQDTSDPTRQNRPQQTNAPGDPFGIHNWANPKKSPYPAGDPRNAGTGMGLGLRNQTFYGDPAKGNARQWTRDSAGNWFGASQKYPGASDEIMGAFQQPRSQSAQPPGMFGNVAGFNRPVNLNQFGQGAPYMASLAAAGQRIQQQPHFQPPMNMLPNGFMGFGPGRPQLPMTPMGNGMVNYQGAGYSPKGLALSMRDSGLY
jgi:hypothetical protein